MAEGLFDRSLGQAKRRPRNRMRVPFLAEGHVQLRQYGIEIFDEQYVWDYSWIPLAIWLCRSGALLETMRPEG